MRQNMSAHCRSDVIAFVHELKPSSLLCVAAEDECVAAAGTGPRLERLTPTGVLTAGAPAERFDLAYVLIKRKKYEEALIHLGFLERAQGAALLARLRDLHARRVLVCLNLSPSGGTAWSENDLLGFGFTRIRRYREPEGDLGLFAFDLDTYKVTPDWFGPHDWANPERWGQDWW